MPKKQIRNKNLSRHRNQKKPAKPLRWGQFAVLGMFIMGSIAGGLQAWVQPNRLSVLAYATNVSHSGLLASTNQSRSSNGLSALTINSQLNTAAQAKANDMAAKDYWSHTSPDGRQPWDFITSAGYSYSMAGENLAYGALTSEATVQAWMNSPGHRANILKTEFREVGFGYANSPNYQSSGQQTIIVAMYAKPYGSAPMTAPARSAPSSQPAASTPKPTAKPPAPVTPVASNIHKPSKPKADTKKTTASKKPTEQSKKTVATQPTQAKKSGEKTVTPTAATQPIKRVSLVTGNYSGWMLVLVVVIGVAAGLISFYRHSKAWHRRIRRGEEFIVHHPLIDAVAVMAVIMVVVLMQNVGHIL